TFIQDGSTFTLDPGQFNDLAVGESETLTFTYNVFDGHAKAPQTLTLTVEGRNDLPVLAASLSGASHEDAAPFTADLLAGATDVDATDVLSATDLTQTGGRAVTFIQEDSTFALDPAQFNDLAVGESETLTFTYNVFDGHAKVPQTLTLTVEGRNDGPVAAAVAYGRGEDGPAATFAFNGSDVDHGAVLTYTIVSQPEAGSVTNNDDGTFRFDPAGGFEDLAEGETRDVSFTYRVTDEHGVSSEATAILTVVGANDGPVATANVGSGLESAPILVTASALIGDDSDADHGAVLRLAGVEQAVNGTVAITADGNVIFAPTFGFAGVASFVYVVADEHGATARGSVTLDVAAVDNWLTATAAAELHDGGAGGDTVDYSGSTAAVTINLATGFGSGGWADGDTYARLETVIGSGFNDTLIGDGLDNRLLGGAGADLLNGGAGFDTASYTTSTGAVVVDLGKGSTNKADAKKDTLVSIEGVEGSAYADKLTGDAGANVLAGLCGDDTLEGGAGADRYLFGRGDGSDTVVNKGCAADGDSIVFGAGVSTDQVWLSRSKFDLVAGVIGTADRVVVADWYKSPANQVSAFETADGHVLARASVDTLVQAMAAFNPPPAGQLTLSGDVAGQLAPMLAANWKER
ncbi:MAG: tandem-95 repeat protein, partial [Alphaproteobacteria bacterium]